MTSTFKPFDFVCCKPEVRKRFGFPSWLPAGPGVILGPGGAEICHVVFENAERTTWNAGSFYNSLHESYLEPYVVVYER